VEVKEQYQVKTKNGFAALKNLMMWISAGVGKVLERI